jgi:hypothetical protein
MSSVHKYLKIACIVFKSAVKKNMLSSMNKKLYWSYFLLENNALTIFCIDLIPMTHMYLCKVK